LLLRPSVLLAHFARRHLAQVGLPRFQLRIYLSGIDPLVLVGGLAAGDSPFVRVVGRSLGLDVLAEVLVRLRQVLVPAR